jgi:hypothetical protein
VPEIAIGSCARGKRWLRVSAVSHWQSWKTFLIFRRPNLVKMRLLCRGKK